MISLLRSVFRASHPCLGPVRRVLITSGVCHTLFTQFRAESLSLKGFCETGWMLWGYRRPNEVLVTATVNAGPKAKRWENRVEFDREHQYKRGTELQSKHPLLRVLGACHTHPYRCIRPSGSDYSGDSEWVRLLTGCEGVFGIGTEGKGGLKVGISRRDGLEFHWYALGEDDLEYRRIPVATIKGGDLGQGVG